MGRFYGLCIHPIAIYSTSSSIDKYIPSHCWAALPLHSQCRAFLLCSNWLHQQWQCSGCAATAQRLRSHCTVIELGMMAIYIQSLRNDCRMTVQWQWLCGDCTVPTPPHTTFTVTLQLLSRPVTAQSLHKVAACEWVTVQWNLKVGRRPSPAEKINRWMEITRGMPGIVVLVAPHR